MNTSAETNINIRLNPVNKDFKFRLLHEKPEGCNQRKYIAQFAGPENNEWVTMQFFKEDTKEYKPAWFNNEKKAKRFIRKILIANDIEVPEDFLIYDEATETYREDPEQAVRDDVEKHYWLHVVRMIIKDWRRRDGEKDRRIAELTETANAYAAFVRKFNAEKEFGKFRQEYERGSDGCDLTSG